jgi:hypothetical protein
MLKLLKDDPELKALLLESVIKSAGFEPSKIAANCTHSETYDVAYGKGRSTICHTCGTVLVRDSGLEEEIVA